MALDGDRPPVPAKKVRSTCRFHEASFDVTIEAGGSGRSRPVGGGKETQPCGLLSIFRISRAIILYLLERWWGLNGDTARRLGPLLSQGCQFAFVLLAADAIQGVMGEPTANLLKLAVTLSIAATSLDAGLDKEGRVPSLREESRPTRNKKNSSARGRY
jgi:hypothetical protein